MKQANKSTTNGKPTPKPKGFAAMPHADVIRIARMGGKAISKDRERMRNLGRAGGLAPRKAKKAA